MLHITNHQGNANQNYSEDFSGGAVDKNLPTNAGDVGSIPGQGRFCHDYQAHTLEPTSLCAAITEAHVSRAMLCNRRSYHNEKSTPCNKELIPLATTRESPHKPTKTQHRQK